MMIREINENKAFHKKQLILLSFLIIAYYHFSNKLKFAVTHDALERCSYCKRLKNIILIEFVMHCIALRCAVQRNCFATIDSSLNSILNGDKRMRKQKVG